MTTDTHPCQTCGLKHRRPRAHRIPTALGIAITFIAIEILAALALHGWLAVGLYVIAAVNALRVVLVVIGTSIAAVEGMSREGRR